MLRLYRVNVLGDDMTTIAGKTIVLTGASRGIGKHIALALAAQPVTLVGVSRSAEGLKQVCDQIEVMGSKAVAIPFDLSQIEDIPHLLDQIKNRVGTVDILINNAGIEIYRAFPDYSLKDMQSVLSINLLAAMTLTHGLLPDMLIRGGHIVNIASLAAKKGHPYDSLYSASKAGLLMWSDAIRQELAHTGVKISTVCPGYVEGEGLLADTGVPAPKLGGVSKPGMVAKAVVEAIAFDRTEIVVNGSPLMSSVTKLLFATEQLFPRLGDWVNQRLGVTQLNQKRIKTHYQTKHIDSLNKV